MIYADPWGEAVRLEDLLEAELIRSSKPGASRLPVDAFRDAEIPSPSLNTPGQRRPSPTVHSTLGFLYSGRPYKIDSV